MKYLLFVFFAIVTVHNAFALGIDCISCTDPLRPGECTSYGSTCCDPCKAGGGTLEPIECDPLTCSGTTVTDMGGGCEKVETKACKNRLCSTDATARCKKGYYGKPSLSGVNWTKCSGCTECQSFNGVAGVTTVNTVGKVWAQTIAECYIPAGSRFSDNSGSWQFENDCYYKQ